MNDYDDIRNTYANDWKNLFSETTYDSVKFNTFSEKEFIERKLNGIPLDKVIDALKIVYPEEFV